MVCSAFYAGTEVASDRVDAETYAAFNRAVREAVPHPGGQARLPAIISSTIITWIRRSANYSVDDLRESRIVVVDPAYPGRGAAANVRMGEKLGHAEATASPLALVDQHYSGARASGGVGRRSYFATPCSGCGVAPLPIRQERRFGLFKLDARPLVVMPRLGMT